MFDKRLMAATAIAISIAATPALADEKPILGYELFGSGSEKVIVLHDWMGDSENYASAKPWLDDTNFTYAFAEVRGYGRSKEIAGAYTTDEVAGDVSRLADHLGWSKYHFIGHSMTGMAGFKAVMLDWQGDKKIKSFVAVSPVTPDGYPASEDDEAFLTAAMTDDETAANAFGALTGGKLNAAWSTRKMARNRATSHPEALKGYYDMWLGEDFADEFAKANIKTPVLVIGGNQDLPGFLKEYYDKTIAQWIPSATFSYIENAGHYSMQETPVLFSTLIEGHMSAHK